jgi:ABC-type antimicrobial peptide transport system permease subunit
MKISEAIQRIQSLYSLGVQSDDSRLKSRHVYNKMKTIRGRLLYEKANKKQYIANSNYQILNCVELIKAEVHECPCIPPLGCCIYKTKHPLPAPLSSFNRHLIKSVTSLDGNIRYSEISWEDKKYKQYDKYTSTKPDYILTGNHLLVTGKNDVEVIRVELLLEDPLEGYNNPSYCNPENDCISNYEREFHLDNSMFDALIELTAQELIQLFRPREDSSNNTKDTPEQETK